MSHIQKADIIGARIVAVRTIDSETEDGLYHSDVYFITDRGFSFCIPCPGYPWETVEVPPKAKPLPDEYFTGHRCWKKNFPFYVKETVPVVGDIKPHAIAAVLCPSMDPCLGFHEPDTSIILLANGSQISVVSVAPHGIGAGLIHVPKKRAKPLEKLVDFFAVPLVQGEVVKVTPPAP